MNGNDHDDGAPPAPAPAAAPPIPTLVVKEIWFNHDKTKLSRDAMNLSTDSDRAPVELPEWKEGHTWPEDSPAAYAIEDTDGNEVEIKVTFTLSQGGQQQVEIRAQGGGVLGSLDPKVVPFSNGLPAIATGTGVSEYVFFVLSNRQLAAIHREDIDWNWEFRLTPGQGNWMPAANNPTKHRVYTVLRNPPEPWTQDVDDPSHWPWTVILDRTTQEADGKVTEIEAAKVITACRNAVHGAVYETSHGDTAYSTYKEVELGGIGRTMIHFLLKKFVDKKAAVGSVNCADMALATVTYATSVGCRMTFHTHEPFGFINETYPIGLAARVNNPFFTGTGQRPWFGCQTYTNIGLVTRSDDLCRSLFGFHAYGVIDTQIFDATFGPHLGTARPDYLNAMIDDAVPPEITAYRFNSQGVMDEYRISKKREEPVSGAAPAASPIAGFAPEVTVGISFDQGLSGKGVNTVPTSFRLE
jgi:hypothetical protein